MGFQTKFEMLQDSVGFSQKITWKIKTFPSASLECFWVLATLLSNGTVLTINKGDESYYNHALNCFKCVKDLFVTPKKLKQNKQTYFL